MRDVPRSHPQAANPVLTTLRAPCLFLMHCKAKYKTHVRLESGDESPHSKVTARPYGQRCLFLTPCKAEYKTHVRIESGDESPHSKVTARPYGRCAHGLTWKLNGGRSALRALCLFLMQYKTVPDAGTLPIGGPEQFLNVSAGNGGSV